MKRRKIGYIICLISILWLNVFYIDYSVFMLLVMFISVPLISCIFMRIAWLMQDISVTLEKEAVAQGQDIKIWVKNSNKLASIFVKHIEADISMSFLQKEIPYRVIDKRNRLLLNINSEHVGILNVNIKRINIYDFFMIFCGRKKIQKQKDIIVMPKMVLADDDRRGNSNYQKNGVSEEYVFSYEPDDNTEVIDLRQYRHGDAINHIHWNLSSVSDEYIVKQYGSSVKDKNIIVADIIPIEKEEDRYLLDKIYCALYSVGNVFAENGILAEFAVWNEESGQLQELVFDDIASLNGAICNLMKVRGSYTDIQSVFEMLDMQYENGYDREKTTCITMSDIDGIENVYNIHDTKIKDIVNNMYDVILN